MRLLTNHMRCIQKANQKDPRGGVAQFKTAAAPELLSSLWAAFWLDEFQTRQIHRFIA